MSLTLTWTTSETFRKRRKKETRKEEMKKKKEGRKGQRERWRKIQRQKEKY